jgi:hypothetical protein
VVQIINSQYLNVEQELLEFDIAQQIFMYYLLENGKHINPKTTLYDSEGQEHIIEEFILKDSISFFIHIPSGGCHSCIPEMLSDISKSESADYSNLYFFTSYINF